MKEYRCKECNKKLNLDETVVLNEGSKDIFCDTQKASIEEGSCARRYVEKHLDQEFEGGWCWIRLVDYKKFLNNGDYKIICK